MSIMLSKAYAKILHGGIPYIYHIIPARYIFQNADIIIKIYKYIPIFHVERCHFTVKTYTVLKNAEAGKIKEGIFEGIHP